MRAADGGKGIASVADEYISVYSRRRLLDAARIPLKESICAYAYIIWKAYFIFHSESFSPFTMKALFAMLAIGSSEWESE